MKWVNLITNEFKEFTPKNNTLEFQSCNAFGTITSPLRTLRLKNSLLRLTGMQSIEEIILESSILIVDTPLPSNPPKVEKDPLSIDIWRPGIRYVDGDLLLGWRLSIPGRLTLKNLIFTKDTHISNFDLSDVGFSHCTIENLILEKSSISHCSFTHSVISNGKIQNTTFTDSHFLKTYLAPKWKECTLTGTNFYNCTFPPTQIDHVTFHDVTFDGCSFIFTQWIATPVHPSQFPYCNFKPTYIPWLPPFTPGKHTEGFIALHKGMVAKVKHEEGTLIPTQIYTHFGTKSLYTESYIGLTKIQVGTPIPSTLDPPPTVFLTFGEALLEAERIANSDTYPYSPICLDENGNLPFLQE